MKPLTNEQQAEVQRQLEAQPARNIMGRDVFQIIETTYMKSPVPGRPVLEIVHKGKWHVF